MSSISITDWTASEIDFYLSSSDSTQREIESALSQEGIKSLKACVLERMEPTKIRISERESQRRLMAEKRAGERDIPIHEPVNMERRLRALSDPEFLLSTYFSDLFDEAFTEDRSDMLHSIIHAAKYAGDKAIAGPRGEGKTTIAVCGAICLMLGNLTSFPVVIGKSQSKAEKELRDMVERLQTSDELEQDFPEIAIPFRAVGAWSSRARGQTVGGLPSMIKIAPELFSFPSLAGQQMGWRPGIESVARGQVMAAIGIDGPIRGTKHRGKRPTLAIIDDIESREAAESEKQIEQNEKIIEEDIAGMGRSARRIPRIFLCTIQNRKCIAYRYTDPKIKPSWNGKRYRKMIKRPDRMDLVQEYIDMRRMRKESDRDAREAFRYWRDRREIIEAGHIVSNEASFDDRLHPDGEMIELSACQAYFNRVADTSEKAVATEIDNDPPEEAGPMGIGLTADIVASRISGLARRQLPANTTALTAAIDLGKYRCHWVIMAWWHGAGGVVVDYGVAEVLGTDPTMNHEASEPAIYAALLNWRDELLRKNFVDALGVNRKIDFVLVDSGTFTNAAYEFVRQVKGVFHCSKGVSPYRQKKESTSGIIAGTNLHASHQPAQNLWLYDLDTHYWKQWVHERFLTPTFDENNMLRRGSLSLFSDSRRHSMFAQHIVAEELVTEFKEGKGTKTYWDQKDENNHFLDATYMAAAASEICGVKLIAPPETEIEPRHVEAKQKQAKPVPKQQHGQRFRTRPGGWIRGARRG